MERAAKGIRSVLDAVFRTQSLVSVDHDQEIITMKHQFEDEALPQEYVPISLIRITPNNGPETVGGTTYPQAINSGQQISVVIELTGSAQAAQAYAVSFQSTASALPSTQTLTVPIGQTLSNSFGFAGPTVGLPAALTITAAPTGGGEPPKAVTVWLRA
jgi:hypothetical protein